MGKKTRTERAKKAIAPFDLNRVGHPRFGFRDWVRTNFPYFAGRETPQERERVLRHRELIAAGARAVLRLVEERSDQPLRDYYRGDRERIGYAQDDEEFLRTIDSLLGGIDCE